MEKDYYNTDGLRSWKDVHVKSRNFGASNFKPFLPKDPSFITSHEAFYILKPPDPWRKGVILPADR